MTESLTPLQRMFTQLNPEQKKAVEIVDGPVLVLAGAGSGKTRVLTTRVAHLILNHHVSPENILAVTFTNKAANEMKERLYSMLGAASSNIWIATFHSTGLRILKQQALSIGFSSNFVVYDTKDVESQIKQLMKHNELIRGSIRDKKIAPGYFSSFIDSVKNICTDVDEYAELYPEQHDLDLKILFYKEYQKALLKSNAMDFGDLIAYTVKLFDIAPNRALHYGRRFQYILIDEFQDTNPIQYALVKHLTKENKNIFVVGDEDQSIYNFRGAKITNILDFEKDYPGTELIKLEKNYRSTKTILSAANGVIQHNMQRKGKVLWTDNVQGDKIHFYEAYDDSEEAQVIIEMIERFIVTFRIYSYNDIAIFYRTNPQSRVLEEKLVLYNIPYKIYGGLKFYDRKEIKDILAYLRVLFNDRDEQSFVRIINTPSRKIGEKTVSKIQEIALQNDISFLEATRIYGKEQSNVREFIALYDELKNYASCNHIAALIQYILERTLYLQKLLETEDEHIAAAREENIRELMNFAKELERSEVSYEEELSIFLERTSLSTDTEDKKVDEVEGQALHERGKQQTVSLMTLHAAKGLEFPCVFFSGFEEGLIPHFRSIEANDLEEERRLCYVGITRAKERLFISRSGLRGYSSNRYQKDSRYLSRFLEEIPEENLEIAPLPFAQYEALTMKQDPLESDFQRKGAKGTIRRKNIKLDNEGLCENETAETFNDESLFEDEYEELQKLSIKKRKMYMQKLNSHEKSSEVFERKSGKSYVLMVADKLLKKEKVKE
jgi:DNA helicase II / ATP-dependent DNA helicase PcrA